MNAEDPKLIVLQFNKCINNHDLKGLALLMTEDHTFIDREGKIQQPKEIMLRHWGQFFGLFPGYRNTFTRLESTNQFVVVLGHAYWSEERPRDPVIWTALIVDDHVREWRIYSDTPENRLVLHVD